MTNFASIEKQIGYVFKNKHLLLQAFTRDTYTHEHKNVPHNQVLEFYGDTALGLVIAKRMSRYFGKVGEDNFYHSFKNEGELTTLKAELVRKEMLSNRVRALDLQKNLRMGRGDMEQRAFESRSVQEDLFEAILGAVAIDSCWNVQALEDVVGKMIDVEHYFKGIEYSVNYVDSIQIWCQKKYGVVPDFKLENSMLVPQWLDIARRVGNVISSTSTRGKFVCLLTLGKLEKRFEAWGETKREARNAACEEAYHYLMAHDQMMDSPLEDVGAPNVDKAINQLQELYQKGYIGEPRYEFFERYDKNGTPFWYCECTVGKKARQGYYPSKKQGKKRVAFEMLCDILDWNADDGV